MVRSSVSLGHVARADLIEDGGADGRQQPQLADLADRNCERGSDGLFGPVLGGEALDGAPEVDRGHGGAYNVFAHRPHLVVVIGFFDQDVDVGEPEFDGGADGAWRRRRRSVRRSFR